MYTILHSHWESRYDAVPKTQDMIDRLVSIGAKAVAITDHGSVAAIEDAYDAIQKCEADLKIIYGMEGYLETDCGLAHLILMAKDVTGKHAIDKIVYASNQNIVKVGKSSEFPVIKKEVLEDIIGENGIGHGHVVLTTACISGPIGIELSSTKKVMANVAKIEEKIKTGIESGKMLDSSSGELQELSEKRECLFNENKEITASKADLNKIAKKKSDGLRKRANRYREAGKIDMAEELERQIKVITEEAQAAQKQISELTCKAEANKRMISELNEKIKEMSAMTARFDKLKEEIVEEKKKIRPISVLLKRAKEQVIWLEKVAGPRNLYAEVQYHGMSEEKEIYQTVVKLAKELNLPLVAANDAHMANNTEHDLNARLVARYLRFEKLDDPERVEHEKEMYLKDKEQLKAALLEILSEEDVDEALINADKIGDICDGYVRDTTSHYPVYNKNVDAKELIRKLAYEGIEWRFPNKVGWTQEYADRLEYELKTINQMGYADYHLIVKKMLDYGRLLGRVPKDRINEAPLDIDELKAWVEENHWDVGIGVGFARGSAAGSLVCYLLGITGIDPIKYGLLFERE